jgi:predicted DsbA family dithiol-disulfide isomerase
MRRIVADVEDRKVPVRLITNPWCPWGWAAEPSRRRLEAEFGDALAWEIVMAPAPAPDPREWLDASDASGMPVDPRRLLEDPPASTNPAALAVVGVLALGDARPYLRRLQEAIFLGRARPDRADALMDVAREAGGYALDRLHVEFGSNATVEGLGAHFDRAGERRTPTFVIGEAELGGDTAYEQLRAAVALPPAQSPSIEDALRRFGRMATAEVAAVCDLPGPRAAAELWRLALEWRVRPQRVLGGELWSL